MTLEQRATDLLLDMAGKSMSYDKSVARLTAAFQAVRNEALENAAAIADRCSKPDGSKNGDLYHMHVGAVTAAYAIAETIRSYKSDQP